MARPILRPPLPPSMPLFRPSGLPETFPEVRAVTLDGDERTLPADLPAPLTLVVVLFKDDLDPLADQWARLGHDLEARYPGTVAVVETPVVGRGMKLFGSLATTGIRGQVDDDREHARTLPIYVDKKPFCKALRLSSTSDVTAYLVERDTGRVLWGGDGEIDMQEVLDLERTVETAASDRTPAPDAGTPEDDRAAPPAFRGPGELDAAERPEASGEAGVEEGD